MSLTEYNDINGSLDRWLVEFRKPPADRSEWFGPWCFPGELLDEYLNGIQDREEAEVRNILRSFLLPTTVLVTHDKDSFDFLLRRLRSKEVTPSALSEFERRLVMHYTQDESVMPWQGITWAMDLIDNQPQMAIDAIAAYWVAHFVYLSDGWLSGMDQSMAIIRAYYMGVPKSPEEAIELLYNLTPRDFEHLIDQLYRRLGYTTELTKPSSDGGRDIKATKVEGGHTSNIYIECKKWRDKVPVGPVRSLYGVVAKADLDKGILCAPHGFTARGNNTAVDFAKDLPRIELLGENNLLEALSRGFGLGWTSQLDGLVAASKARVKS